VKRASALLAVVVAAGVGNTAIAAGPTLKSGDIAQAGLWYGRAGGLVGADRVAHLEGSIASAQVAVSYDKDVAARTNMSSDRAGGTSVGISYDADVAQRTNMPRGQEAEPIQSAKIK
jgi:hypothetical protein